MVRNRRDGDRHNNDIDDGSPRRLVYVPLCKRDQDIDDERPRRNLSVPITSPIIVRQGGEGNRNHAFDSIDDKRLRRPRPVPRTHGDEGNRNHAFDNIDDERRLGRPIPVPRFEAEGNRNDAFNDSDDERPPQFFFPERREYERNRNYVFDEIEEDDEESGEGDQLLAGQRQPLFTNPLQRRRSVRDVLYLVIFRIFLVSWLIVILLAFSIGDLQHFQQPVDSEGRRCGVDIQVKDKSFLFLFDISKYNNGSNSTILTCTRECPQATYIYKKNVTQDVKNIIPKLICKEGIDLHSVKNWNELDEYVKDAKCAELYLESTSLFNRCVPTRVPDELQDRISNETVEQLKKLIKVEIAKGSMLHYLYVEGIAEAKYILIGFTLLAGALSVTYAIAFRWLGKIFVMSSIYILNVSLVFGIYKTAETYFSDETKIFPLLASIALTVGLAFFILSLYYAHRRSIVCEVIEKSCRAAGLSWITLCVPIFVFFLCVLIVLLSTIAILYLSTIKYDTFKVKISDDGCNCPSKLNYTHGALCDPDTFMRECKTNINGTCFESGCHHVESTVPGYITFMQIICWCGYWLVFLLVLFSRTVLAGAFAEYYWTEDKTLVPRFILLKMMEITTWYHCGSLLVGSLAFVLEIFRDYRTRFTFSAIAIYGQSYRRSYSRVLRFFRTSENIHIFYLFDKKLTFWLRIGSFSITGLTTGIAWLSCASFFEEDAIVNTNITGTSIFLLIIGIVSLFIASLTMEVLKIATVTVCICYMEDNALNAGGAPGRHYLISPEFLDIIRNELEIIRIFALIPN